MISLPPEAVELYGLEPGAFVAARNALVKALKRDKRVEDASTVVALRRPSPADHAINAAVRAQPDVTTVWVEAVIALDDEQRAAIGGAPNHLREAGVALREASAQLVDAAVAAVGDERRRPAVIDVLRAAATRPGAALVAAGILGAGDPTDELFAGAPEPPARPKPPAPAKPMTSQKPPPAAKPATAAAEPEPRPTKPRSPSGDELAARRDAATAERVAAAEAGAHAAEEALAAARAAESAARQALQDATAALRRAQAAATRADASLAAARRAAARQPS